MSFCVETPNKTNEYDDKKELKEPKKWLSDQFAELLPRELHDEIYRRYSHTLGNMFTGAEEVINVLEGLQPPSINWNRRIRGCDAVVNPCFENRVGTDSFELQYDVRKIYRTVESLVPLKPARYRYKTTGGKKREKRDRKIAEEALKKVMPVWASLIMDELHRILTGELWQIRYNWAVPGRSHYCKSLYELRIRGRDAVIPEGIEYSMTHIQARPVTALSHAIAQKEKEELDIRVNFLRPKLLAVTVDDVIKENHGEVDGAFHKVNRAGYLLGIIGINCISKFEPRGLSSAVEKDPEISKHCSKLRNRLLEMHYQNAT